MYEEAGFDVWTTPFYHAPHAVITRLEPVWAEDMPLTVRLVASSTTGDNHIDREGLAKRGIKVVTLRDCDWNKVSEITSTAEHTVALTLALLRNFHTISKGETRRELLTGRELSRMKCGIIGFGRVGKMVANLLAGFGVYFRVFDKGDEVDYDGMDIVFLHVPLDGNKGMIAEREFSKMKDGVYIINTSRAEVVDEGDLIKALDSGKIAGYASDFPIESLKSHPKCLFTPHIGGNTVEGMRKAECALAEKVIDILNEKNSTQG